MNMAELYTDMKDALAYLGLSFHEMDQVEVTLNGSHLTFSYDGRSCTVEVPSHD